MARRKTHIELTSEQRERLLNRIKSSTLSQIDIAKQLGVSYASLNRALKGKGKDGFSQERYTKLLEILEKSEHPQKARSTKKKETLPYRDGIVHGILKCGNDFIEINTFEELQLLVKTIEEKLNNGDFSTEQPTIYTAKKAEPIERESLRIFEGEKPKILAASRITFDCISRRLYHNTSLQYNKKGKPSFPRNAECDDLEVISQEAGGTLANVVCNLAAFGSYDVYPIAQLGNSEIANFMLSDLERFGCKTDYVETERGQTYIFKCHHNVSDNGEAYMGRGNYDVRGKYDNHANMYNLKVSEVEDLVKKIAITPTVFYFSNHVPSYKHLAKHFYQKGSLCYFEPKVKNEVNEIMNCLPYADVFKCSRVDVPNIEDFMGMCKDKLVIQTLDKDGVRFSLKGADWHYIEAYKLDSPVVDTEGCGDMLSASIIHQLALHNCFTVDEMTDEIITECLLKAQPNSAKVARYYGSKGVFYRDAEFIEKYGISAADRPNYLLAPRISNNIDLKDIPKDNIMIYDKKGSLGYNSQFLITDGVKDEESYTKKKGYCVLSNFYQPCNMRYNGVDFESAEQMYHYYKFYDQEELRDAIMAEKDSHAILNICKGQRPSDFIEDNRWKWMTLAIETKFLCCKEFRDAVIASGEKNLVEVQTKKFDIYGACCDGADEQSKNLPREFRKGIDDLEDKFVGMNGCGRCLMSVREKFKGWSEEEILAYEQPSDIDMWWSESQVYLDKIETMGKRATVGIVGAMYGDVIGFPYESKGARTKKLDFNIDGSMGFSDDTVLTMAIADWLMSGDLSKENVKNKLLEYGRKYESNKFFGKGFKAWVASDGTLDRRGVTTNGAAMRVSPIGYVAKDLGEVLYLADLQARITHDSDEASRGAQAAAACVFLAYHGSSKQEIKDFIEKQFGYNLNRTTDEIRPNYEFEMTCDKCVPEAIICYLESSSYEEAVRKAVSLGGDADTLACIAGSIAAATPNMSVSQALTRKLYRAFDDDIKDTLDRFNKMFIPNCCQ